MNAVMPNLIDPVLSYLSRVLPSPLYSFLIDAVSHCLALGTALFSLLTSLVSTHPLNWESQTLLPPLITMLAAYLALVSFYRTTTWMFRASLWFVKWGVIVGALAAGAGWYTASSSGGHSGVVNKIGRVVLDMINRREENLSGSSPRLQGQRGHSGPSERKPKPWESFQRHQGWRYQRQEYAQDTDVQKIIGDIVNAARNVLKESGWWSVANSIVEGGSGKQVEEGEDRLRQHLRRSKAGTSRSR